MEFSLQLCLEGQHPRVASLLMLRLVGFTNKMSCEQTNREHRYKYTGDNREDGRHLEGGGDNKDITKTGETDQGVT